MARGDWIAYCECECDKGVEAFVKIVNPDGIHFCPAFFNLSIQKQSKVVLHELSHYYATTKDHGLGNSITHRNDKWSDFPDDAYWMEKFHKDGGTREAAAEVFDRFLKGAVTYY